MQKADRVYRLYNLLNTSKFISRKSLEDALEVSRATLTRDLDFLRDQLQVAVEYNRDLGGYRIDRTVLQTGVHELPGMWFREEEIHALLAIEQILESIQPGLLSPHLTPLKTRLNQALSAGGYTAEQIRRRISLIPANARKFKLAHFEICATATLSRKQLKIGHFDRYLDCETERFISPQRLVRYKDNWYLDSWCHLRNAIRTFSVDALTDVEITDEVCHEISDAALDHVLRAGYGIYAGADVEWAKLKFSSLQSRWAALEIWHPEQRGSLDSDGVYTVEFPFSGIGELVMDILKFGPSVEVLAPASLRQEVAHRLRMASNLYRTI